MGGIQIATEGVVRVEPDLASVSLAVQSKRTQTLEQARAEAAEAMAAVLKTLGAKGVASNDIQTTGLRVGPEYDYVERERRLAGYVGRHQVQVTLRNLEEVGPVVDAALAASRDAGQLQGIRFGIAKPERARAEARSDALARATRAARQIAEESSLQLGPIFAVTEHPDEGTGPSPLALSRAEGSSTTRVEAGTIEVRVRLTVSWSVR